MSLGRKGGRRRLARVLRVWWVVIRWTFKELWWKDRGREKRKGGD